MLLRLIVSDLALAGELDVELAPGLNVISGETGAGKSVLVEALALLVGERADAGAIRAGADRAIVEGLFRLTPDLRAEVAELTGESTDEVALRRELVRNGTNRCYVNGRLASAGLLRELGDRLLELHGQHEHQRLLRPAVQRELLDAFGGLEDARRRLEADVRSWRAARRRLDEVRTRTSERAERIARLREEVDEIAALDPRPEEERLRQEEAERLRSVEDLRELASRALDRLSGEEPSGLDLLRAVRADVQALGRREPRLAGATARFTALVEDVADLARELERYHDGLTGDPERLAELDRREADLLRLTRRYATDAAGLLARAELGRAELAQLEGEGEEASGLERSVAGAEERLRAAARELSAGRARAARELAAAVTDNLRDLGLGAGGFEARLEPLGELEGAGLERVEFLVAPNAGEPAGALRSVASGGELSRIVLALKAALARADSVPTLVFDEVDAGVGGRVARRVAEKLVGIAWERQVIAVTHLAVVAAPAELHLRVEKSVVGGRSRIGVAPVAGDERVEELSRMLGGEPESEVSRRHARELLSGASGRSSSRARPARASRRRGSRSAPPDHPAPRRG